MTVMDLLQLNATIAQKYLLLMRLETKSKEDTYFQIMSAESQNVHKANTLCGIHFLLQVSIWDSASYVTLDVKHALEVLKTIAHSAI